MRREEYLTKPKQYAVVHHNGSYWTNNLLVMKVLANELTFSRYGFSVSRRVGNAVVRNRMKRLLREILRQTPLQPGWDIVFVVRTRAANAGYSELKNAVDDLLSRAKVLLGEYEELYLKSN